jgi:hypothetical protein
VRAVVLESRPRGSTAVLESATTAESRFVATAAVSLATTLVESIVRVLLPSPETLDEGLNAKYPIAPRTTTAGTTHRQAPGLRLDAIDVGAAGGCAGASGAVCRASAGGGAAGGGAAGDVTVGAVVGVVPAVGASNDVAVAGGAAVRAGLAESGAAATGSAATGAAMRTGARPIAPSHNATMPVAPADVPRTVTDVAPGLFGSCSMAATDGSSTDH